jgi:hypothetical protein
MTFARARRWIPLTVSLLLACGAVAAQAPDAAPALLELFTSQGCSSCPPADAVLGELARQPNVVALAFHVDYWDSLGWRDRFEVLDATPRQRRYTSALRLPSAFTPQAVVNGRGSFVGSDRGRIAAALRSTSLALQLRLEGGELVAELPSGDSSEPCDVMLASYLSQASTAIGRGENEGRTLKEFNVVRSFTRLGDWRGRPGTLRVALSSLPAEADGAAVFIEQRGQGGIVAVRAIRLR